MGYINKKPIMGRYVLTFESFNNQELSQKVEAAFQAYLKEDERISCENVDDEFEYGHPFLICTNGAKWVRNNFFPEAVIMGYYHENNNTAEIGEAEGGHDFLVLDNRYIIDFWFRTVYNNDSPIFLDMETEKAVVNKLYGDPSTWIVVE